VHNHPPFKAALGTMNEVQESVGVTGGCFCGQIRYRVIKPLFNARSCHCSKCRKAFSGAGSAYAEVQANSFIWVTGQEDVVQYYASPEWGLGFCGRCGTTLCGINKGRIHGVTLGSVDGDPGVEIEVHLFVGSKAPWDHIGGTAPQYADWPPEPQR